MTKLNLTELQTLLDQAVTIESVKKYRDNLHAPIYQVNAQVFDWAIAKVYINGVDFTEWSKSFKTFQTEYFTKSGRIAGEFGFQRERFNTKKQAKPAVVEFLCESILDLDYWCDDPRATEEAIKELDEIMKALVT